MPLRIASTVFLVELVSLAICELLNSDGYLFINHKIAYGFSCLKESGVYFVSFFLGGNDSIVSEEINSNFAESSVSHLLISISGYLFDTILVFFVVYNFQTSLYFGVLPIWMIVLWPSVAILFDEILIFLSKHKIIAVVLSSILGPLTYFAGSPLGLININNLFLFFVLMTFFWAILMIFYLNYIIKIKFN